MTTDRLRRAGLLWGAALLLLAAPAYAQPADATPTSVTMPTSGLRAEYVADLEQLEQKYVGLAEAMTNHYAWRPEEGVRSVSEVLMHVAGANYMIPNMVGVQPPGAMRAASMQEGMAKMQELQKITDRQQILDHLRQSFAHARNAVAMTPDDQLDARTMMFGRDVSKRQVLSLLVTHLHEHLGQSIAYARAQGVMPPWSAGEN